MTVAELIRQLSNPSCPQDAEVICCDERSAEEKARSYFKPAAGVVWWSDDRKNVYIGEL